MKRLISIVLLLALTVCALASCSPAGKGNDSEADTTVPEVTSPDGFDDVTAPPEETTDADKKDTTDADTTEEDPLAFINDAEEAVAAARKWLGESDPDTGYKYAYSYDGSVVENNVPLFRIRVSWYIEEQERYSFCGYLLVNPDGTITKYSW